MDETTSREVPSSLEVLDVWKSFATHHHTVEVLSGISFTLQAGEALAITGPSGSGKSTLLHLIGTLDTPTRGEVRIGGTVASKLPERQLAEFRNTNVGFVFQDHHLLPQYSVLENVLLPTLAFPGDGNGARQRAVELLARVGLAERTEHRPAELSGGERQRVALARALIQSPGLLLCDEPTGNLDRATAGSVSELLFGLHRDERNILIVVTHSQELAAQPERRFELREGKCVEV